MSAAIRSKRTEQAGLRPCENPLAHGAISFSGSAPEWSAPPADLQLADDEVHVWIAWLDTLVSDLPRFAETLSAGEHRRVERFQFEQDRNRFIARRGLLRVLLARYLDADPVQLAFSYRTRGKPVLSSFPDSTTLQFNLSHSAGLVLFAVTRRVPVGVDVERVRALPDADQVAAKCFSDRENAMLGAVPAEQRLEAFFNCWTRKEAYLKATGEGIIDALPQIEVSLAPGQPAQLLRVNGDSRAGTCWFLHSLAPAPGFVGAFACQRRSFEGIEKITRRHPSPPTGDDTHCAAGIEQRVDGGENFDQRYDSLAGKDVVRLVRRFAYARIQTAS